ncbi:6-hydroxy-D-nicotine oxidase [Hartmannibacter diazotrophicus]|uniref:6-hydroxy-D-nicotine oxidase n=1 Tax=Hartmannibacter diazotrophicus TaxID=1482074 RepID=A0A2C9D9M0_9HYPH|nr:FAD-binding oxidoreductase [Hartmannibacter diazotrophicus]SON56838.1 6-hydroxy-D-nicotine oxidase [Hartmannibacter diazotrophicus]
MTIEILKRSVRGEVLTHTDDSYCTARNGLLWNGRKPQRSPQIIVKAACAADVQAVVRYASTHGLHVSARGSGHNCSGIALQDSIVVDLSGLAHISVDMARRVAEVGPGVVNRELVRSLEAIGLAFPAGHCGSVAVSGYLLGGGIGWNSGEWGAACENVESVDVVLADGELRRVSATEHPDIFWAVRGGGPEFFGIVTGYRLKLQPLRRHITTSVFTYPLGRIAEVRDWMAASVEDGPNNLEFTVTMTSPPPPLAGAVSKVVSGIATVFATSEAEARATLSRISDAAPVGALHIQEEIPTSYDMLYDIIAGHFPEGARYGVESFWEEGASGSFVADLAAQVEVAPTPETFALAVVVPERDKTAKREDMAFALSGRVFGCAYAIWRVEELDGAGMSWLRATSDRVGDKAIGHYVGECDLEREGRLERCYTPATWRRLQALKTLYDPAGMFAHRRGAAAPMAAMSAA